MNRLNHIVIKSILALGIILSAQSLSAESILGMIQKGKIKEATDSLSKLSTASNRDGNTLYYLSLIEIDGNKSALLMEASLNASVSPIYVEQINYKLIQYYFANGDYKKAKRQINNYYVKWENGKYLGEIIRIDALINQSNRKYEKATRLTDKYLLLYTNRRHSQQGTLDKARIMIASGKKIGADKLLKKLSRQKKGEGVSQALYLLAIKAISKNRIDDAVFYYNLLREEYPLSIGQEAIIEKMMNTTEDEKTDGRAEKLTGTYYTIQVGVFSKKSNAKDQAKIFKSHGKKVEIKNKKVSNQKYHVVYVGKFQSYSEALAFKELLESTHKEVFQIITR